jgi:hypothetical protein
MGIEYSEFCITGDIQIKARIPSHGKSSSSFQHGYLIPHVEATWSIMLDCTNIVLNKLIYCDTTNEDDGLC